jgi:hypothetical protein
VARKRLRTARAFVRKLVRGESQIVACFPCSSCRRDRLYHPRRRSTQLGRERHRRVRRGAQPRAGPEVSSPSAPRPESVAFECWKATEICSGSASARRDAALSTARSRHAQRRAAPTSDNPGPAWARTNRADRRLSQSAVRARGLATSGPGMTDADPSEAWRRRAAPYPCRARKQCC